MTMTASLLGVVAVSAAVSAAGAQTVEEWKTSK